jgi:hypothetical protein
VRTLAIEFIARNLFDVTTVEAMFERSWESAARLKSSR